MVDSDVYYAEVASKHKPVLDEVDDTPAYGESECLCHVCLKSKQRGVRPKTSMYSSYDGIYPDTTMSLTDHQYLLCPPSVCAYIFKSRAWRKSLRLTACLYTGHLERRARLTKVFAGRIPRSILLFRSHFRYGDDRHTGNRGREEAIDQRVGKELSK